MSASFWKAVKIALAVIVVWWIAWVLYLVLGGIHTAEGATKPHFLTGIKATPIRGNPTPEVPANPTTRPLASAAALYGPFRGACWIAPFGSRFNDITGLKLVSVYRRYRWCKTANHRKVYGVRRGGLVVSVGRLSFLASVSWKATSVQSGYKWEHPTPLLHARRKYVEYIRVHGEQCLPIIKAILCKGYTKWSDVSLSPTGYVAIFHRKP